LSGSTSSALLGLVDEQVPRSRQVLLVVVRRRQGVDDHDLVAVDRVAELVSGDQHSHGALLG